MQTCSFAAEKFTLAGVPVGLTIAKRIDELCRVGHAVFLRSVATLFTASQRKNWES
jgi:hypothetical protein